MSGLLVILVAAVVVGMGFVVYANTLGRPPTPPGQPMKVERGDRVRVDYIGYFEDGSGVFDTSIEAAAQDNATWPKAITYQYRPEFSPLTVPQVGNRSVVAGFDDGLLGLAVGETKTVVVPPELGYGVGDTALYVHRPLLEVLPVRQEMNGSAFRARFTVEPVDGMTIADPVWNWTVLVSVSGNVVTTTNSPSVGQEIHPYEAWRARVESIDDTANGGAGAIEVRHLLLASDVGRALLRDGSRVFAVQAIDLAAGEFILDYNFRGAGNSWIWIGKVMVFQVTIVSITR